MTGGLRKYQSAEMMVGQNVGSNGTCACDRRNPCPRQQPGLGLLEWWYGWEGTMDIGRWGGTGAVTFDGYSNISVGGRTFRWRRATTAVVASISTAAYLGRAMPR